MRELKTKLRNKHNCSKLERMKAKPAMPLTARVENGVVPLPSGLKLAEGTLVELFPHVTLPDDSSFIKAQLECGSENRWVSVEKYFTGKVVNIGGTPAPHVHLILTDSGEVLRVEAGEQQLASVKENQIYRKVTLRVQAEQHLQTKALRNIRLIEFLPEKIEADEADLQRLWEKGREVWRDVTSATEWVETLRGNR